MNTNLLRYSARIRPSDTVRFIAAGTASLLGLAAPTAAAPAITLPRTVTAPPAAAAPGYAAVTSSTLAQVALPKGALRLAPASVPESVNDVLKTLVKAGGDGIKQGKVEVLAWTGADFKPSRFGAMRAELGGDLKTAGWTYTEEAAETRENPFRVVTVLRTAPTKRGLIGVWAHADDTVMLAWTEVLPADAPGASEATEPAEEHSIKAIFEGMKGKYVPTPPPPAEDRPKAAASAAAPSTFVVAPSQVTVNVMKNAQPSLPSFPRLTVKPGVVRGYVKDSQGNPLAGAEIGVRSSAAGGFYSGASAKSDAKGYYEIAAPWGAAEFYTASISRDYGEGRAAFGLRPADGDAGAFATANGAVENWVLVAYGVADPDDASDQPQYSGNYYGGTFTIDYFIMDPRFPDDTSLPNGAEIEVTLIPVGPLIDGTPGKTIVLQRTVQEGNRTGFYVNNVPVGSYRVVAWLNHEGRRSPLTVRETGPMRSRPFGLEPKEGRDGVVMTFRPGSAKTGKRAAAHGNWDSLQITLRR